MFDLPPLPFKPSTLQLFALAFFILLSTALTCASTFTKSWVTAYTTINQTTTTRKYGIVPYNSSFQDGLAAASISMYIALGLTLLLTMEDAFLLGVILKHGFSQRLRTPFYLLAWMCILTGVPEVLAWLIVVFTLPGDLEIDNGYISQNIGYSVFLALAAGLFVLFASQVARRIGLIYCVDGRVEMSNNAIE